MNIDQMQNTFVLYLIFQTLLYRDVMLACHSFKYSKSNQTPTKSLYQQTLFQADYFIMNETWKKSMQVHFRRLYPGQTTLNVEQLCEAIKLLPLHQENHFASYAIKSKAEDKSNPDDITSFPDLIERIESSFKDKKDTIYLENYFALIDADGDGMITYNDLEAHAEELGATCITEKAFAQLSQKLTHETHGLGKNQFLDIMREYL